MHICRNNQCPARGRKYCVESGFYVRDLKQSMPRQGTEIHPYAILALPNNETINAPPGDGNPAISEELNFILKKQSMPRQGTEILIHNSDFYS